MKQSFFSLLFSHNSVDSSAVSDRKTQSGFTLVEILVVMAIIGILAAISISSFQGSQKKARDAKRKSDLKQIANALETYRNDAGEYPASNASHQIMGCQNQAACSWGSLWEDNNGTIYMIELPSDPQSVQQYHYESDGDSYQLYARLENSLDYDVPTIAGQPAVYNKNCGGATQIYCNYGIASPNAELATPQEE